MEFFKYVKQEIAVIKDRDPAIKSTMEVFISEFSCNFKISQGA